MKHSQDKDFFDDEREADDFRAIASFANWFGVHDIDFLKSREGSPIVSVVVPVYNAEENVAKCLGSLTAQTLSNIEIIVVNYGSGDRSLLDVKGIELTDLRIVVINEVCEGYSKAVSDGLAAARGKYVTIVHAGDYMQPEYLATLYRSAEESDAQVVRSDFVRARERRVDNCELVESNLDADGAMVGGALSDEADADAPAEIDVVKKAVVVNEEKLAFVGSGSAGIITADKRYYRRILCPRDEQILFSFDSSVVGAIYRRDFIEKNTISHAKTAGCMPNDESFWFVAYALADSVCLIDYPGYVARETQIEVTPFNEKEVLDELSSLYEDISFIHADLDSRGPQLFAYVSNAYWHFYIEHLGILLDRTPPKHMMYVLQLAQQDVLEAAQKGHIDYTSMPEEDVVQVSMLIDDPIGFNFERMSKKIDALRLDKREQTC